MRIFLGDGEAPGAERLAHETRLSLRGHRLGITGLELNHKDGLS